MLIYKTTKLAKNDNLILIGLKNSDFSAYLKSDEENKYFYLLLAEIYTKQSDFAQAASTYETMIQKCKKTKHTVFS